MIPPTTPRGTRLIRRPEYHPHDDSVLSYEGDGFNATTFKATMLSGEKFAVNVGRTSNDYSREEFVVAAVGAAPMEDPMF